MKRNTPVLIPVISLLVLTLLTGLYMMQPALSYARSPSFNLTPTSEPPTPTATPGPVSTPLPTPTPPGQGESGGGTDYYLWVQIGHCNLKPLSSDATALPQPEFQVKLRFIHRESGFIKEATVSNGNPNRFSVPYPGKWDVLLIDPPQITNLQGVDPACLNLADLDNQTSAAPVLLDMADANPPAPQMLKCPLLCTLPEPLVLPETGGLSVWLAPIALLIGFGLLVAGLILTLSTRKRVNN